MTKPFDAASEVRALQDKTAQAAKERARAEALRERAEMKLESSLQRLHKIYGVSTIEEAKTVLNDLETSLKAHIKTAQEEILKAEG